MEKDYPELKDYCDKLSKEVPNYAKANGDGVAKFGGWCPEKVKKAVEKVTAAWRKSNNFKTVLHAK